VAVLQYVSENGLI